jgi:para-aminobenzoate synthetase component 1
LNLKEKLNYYGAQKEPFFFTISYNLKNWEVIPLKEMPNDISYAINNSQKSKHKNVLEIQKISLEEYKIKFDKVIKNIEAGNTYLLNLTCETSINNQIELQEIFNNSYAKYKLFYKDKFVSFSPETFVTITNNTINAFPMKGTINANIPNAKNIILLDKKELAEHTMIVDLLRNDLNIVSKNVKVNKFREIQKIHAGNNELLQVSSHIQGTLQDNWTHNIGDILIPLLPAGSITGTPKRSTVNIIEQIENYERNYFSGIWGIFDGTNLDSSVLIRFIEKKGSNFSYKSGGGITIDSSCIDEYNEMLQKIYLP